MVAATLPAAEREKGLLELFLARRLPRALYLLSVLLFVATVTVVLPAGLLLGTALGLRVVESPADVGWMGYIPSALATALLLLAIGSYTLLFALKARRDLSAWRWAA